MKNNKICKTKKRPEPEGSWPLKIHNGKTNVTNDFSALAAAVQKKNNKIDFCILTFLLGHTQIQMGNVCS